MVPSVGQPVEAERHARRSLEVSDGYDRGRLFNTALLSSVLADQKRIEEACEAGVIAVGMAGSVRSVRATAYLRDVARRPESRSGRTSVVLTKGNCSMSNRIRVEFSQDQALVLSDWLNRVTHLDAFKEVVDDRAVWSPLLEIDCTLESKLPGIFSPDYAQELDNARQRLCAELGDFGLD